MIAAKVILFKEHFKYTIVIKVCNNKIHGQTQFKVSKVWDQYHNTYQHKVVTVCQTNIKPPPSKTEWFVKIHIHYYQISLQCTLSTTF